MRRHLPNPYFLTKFRKALIGPYDPILIPKISTKADWEAELAVVIGKVGKNIPRKDAMEYVAGYAVSNDISFRDLQFSTRSDNAADALGSNWVKGKGLISHFYHSGHALLLETRSRTRTIWISRSQ